MISTHWRQPHQPSEEDLRLLDVLSRQAADLVERTQAETALREPEVQPRRASRLLEEAVHAREKASRLSAVAKPPWTTCPARHDLS